MNSRDTDWIYNSDTSVDKLKRLKEMKKEVQNPMDTTAKTENIDKTTPQVDILNRRDPIFDEPTSVSTHAKLKQELRHTKLEGYDGEKFTSERLQTDNSKRVNAAFQDHSSVDTPKTSGGNSTERSTETAPKDIASLRSKLHNYDPLCGCNKCNRV